MIIEELSKEKILAYANFYDFYENESKKERNISEKVPKVKNSNSPDDLFNLILEKDGILDWKGALRIKRYFEDRNYWTQERKEDFLKQIQESGNNPIKNKDIVKNIVNKIKSHGVNFPIASTLIYFFSKGNCPVIDRRAIETLRIYGCNLKASDWNEKDWDNYFEICFDITKHYGISFRQLDKALWIYPDIKKNLLNCKKLSDLNITCEDLPHQ